tara:strand:+ start:759 stop:881 length:123 start_codon:yes stop_codon:yes gene_type:complete
MDHENSSRKEKMREAERERIRRVEKKMWRKRKGREMEQRE